MSFQQSSAISAAGLVTFNLIAGQKRVVLFVLKLMRAYLVIRIYQLACMFGMPQINRPLLR